MGARAAGAWARAAVAATKPPASAAMTERRVGARFAEDIAITSTSQETRCHNIQNRGPAFGCARVKRSARLQEPPPHPNISLTMLRFLASILVALALFVSPVAMANGGAAAMTQGSGSHAMAMDDHCAPPCHSPDDRKADIKMSCAGACAALSPAPLAMGERLEGSRLAAAMIAPRDLTGIRPDRETPPPRASQQT
jgi:hypothetical protein